VLSPWGRAVNELKGAAVFQLFGPRDRLDKTAAGAGWPVEEVAAALRARFADLEHLGDEAGYRLYGVEDRGVRFAVVLVLAGGAGDEVGEVGFLARFTGYQLTDAGLAAINRNLHLSVASYDPSGDIFVIGGVQAGGPFNAAAFSLVIDSWRRDLAIALQGLDGGAIVEAFPAAQFDQVRGERVPRDRRRRGSPVEIPADRKSALCDLP